MAFPQIKKKYVLKKYLYETTNVADINCSKYRFVLCKKVVAAILKRNDQELLDIIVPKVSMQPTFR
jgi:hypothetical protein